MDYIELQKILLSNKPSIELRNRKEELAKLIPEIQQTYDFDQKTVWHPYDVFEHTLRVIDNTSLDKRLRLAALFHDIGKPQSMTIDDDEVGHFYGHWVEGEQIFIKYQDKFNLDEEDIYLIRKLIFYHDLSITSTSIKRFLEEFDSEDMELLFQLKKADILAQNKEFINDRLNELENNRKSINMALNNIKANTSFIETNSVNVNDTSNTLDELYDDRAIIFAALCNQSEDFSYKTKANQEEGTFLVSLHTPNGIVSYSFNIKYWDYFQIVELDYSPITEEISKEENRERLISMIDKEKQYRR